jgi:hypothetical protein
MKKYLLILFISGIATCCCGQENFEGVIKYSIYINNIHAPWLSLTASFKKNKILLETFGGKDTTIAEAQNLIDFESGFSYEIIRDEKKIIKDSIIKPNYKIIAPLFSSDSSKEILYNKCTFVKYDSANPTNKTSGDMLLWLADNLIYDLPIKYHPYAPFILFTNGKNICLSASYTTFLTRNGEARLTMKAVSIYRTILSDSIFLFPKDFAIQQLEYPPKIELSDIQMTEIKGEPSPPPPLLAKSKIKKKQTIKKSASKSTSMKPKQ